MPGVKNWLCRLSLAVMFVSGSSLPVLADPSPPRPNVVLIISDDQGWTDFGFMRHPVIRTPHLDRLSSQSAVFPNGYVPTSLCRASLATLLTGQFGHQHKICCNDPPDGVDRTEMHPFIKQAPALPRLLGNLGYRSLQTGKYWEGHYANAGFTEGMTVKGRHGDTGLEIGRTTMQPIYDFIDRSTQAKQPFFVWYAPMLPHWPHNPPERLLEKYLVVPRHPGLARYYAMCEWLDETVGDLMQNLARRNLEQETLVIFVVDNGWVQQTGERTSPRGWFTPKSKNSPYDGGLRTPVLIRWPGHTRAGTYPDLVSTVDIVPTILAACGQVPPQSMPGLSLLETATGKGALARQAVFGEIFVHTAVDLRRTPLNLTHRWVRKGDWKLIVPASKTEAVELYDIAHDPFELRNRASEPLPVRAELQTLLDQWWSGRDAPLPQ